MVAWVTQILLWISRYKEIVVCHEYSLITASEYASMEKKKKEDIYLKPSLHLL